VSIFYHDITLIGDNGERHVLSGMVDTGAFYSAFPRSLLLNLGVEPVTSMGAQFANGQVEEWDLGSVEAELFGKRLPIIVFFGPEDTILIGAHALETFAVDIDVVNEVLVPKRVAPMMGFYV
jgi:hypothetical protein